MNISGIKNLSSGMIVRTLFGYSVFNFVLLSPTLITEFSITAVGIGALMAAYWFPALFLSLVIGRLADRIGEKTLVIIGCLIISLGTFLISQAMMFELILIGRFISGLGAILFWTTGINLVSKMWENSKISFITSLIVLCYGVGTLLAMLFVPMQESFFGWRSIFMITAIYGLVVAIMVFALAQNPPVCNKKPCSLKRVASNTNLIRIAIAQSFSVGAWTSFLTFFVISLIYEKGINVNVANYTLVIASIAGIIFALIGGYLADKKYTRGFWIFAPLIILSVVLLFINLISGISPILDFALSGFVGALVWIPQGSIWSLPKIMEPEYPNVAMSIIVITTAVSAVSFPLIFGFLVDISSTYLYSFIFLGTVVLVASILSYKIK